MQTGTTIFAGGGTGGHLYPGLAIAEQIRWQRPDEAVLFLCSTREIDARILREEEATFEPIPAAPFAVSPGRLAAFAGSWRRAVKRARELMRDAMPRGPVRVVAMGGFVAAPCVWAARGLGLPVTLVNLDASPGLANRWIARRAGRAVTSATVDGRDWTVIPPIVRSAAVSPGAAGACRSGFGLHPEKPTLLVTGASQGAASINEVMERIAQDRPELLAGWQVIHQTGQREHEGLARAYEKAGIPAVVRAYLSPMGPAWGAADAAISRAGAGSVGEVWANRVPTIFLPYPYHKDQHQKKNAEPLVRCGGAVVLEDRIGAEANAPQLTTTLAGLLRNPARLAAMRAALEGLGPADGARRAAEIILGGADGVARPIVTRAA